MPCKGCRQEEGYAPTPDESAALERSRQQNARGNLKHNPKNNPKNNPQNNLKQSEERTRAKKRTLEEMLADGSVPDGKDDVDLTQEQLDHQITKALQDKVSDLHEQGLAAERDSLLGVFLGTHPFNVTISANHRRLVEHGTKMARKEPAIVKQDGSKLTLHEYDSKINQVLLAKGKF